MRKIGIGCITAVFLWWSTVTVGAAGKPSSVSSLSAVLYEPQSGRFLYEKDADTRRPMASTTKLMTALVAADVLPLDRIVTVPEQAVLVEGSSMGLRGGDRLSVHDLLTGLLLSSGNDAANALALLSCGSLPTFATRMNAVAQQLGMTDSLFVTPSGLDEGGHSSTARDLALLGAAVLQQEELADICAQKTAVVQVGDPPHEVTLSNHNRLLRLYPDAIGLKTGYTIRSGKCLVSAARRDEVTLVVATLNGGDYWNDHIALYEYGFSQTVAVPLPIPEMGDLPVAGGVAGTVSLAMETPKTVVLLQGETVSYTVQLPSFVWAPVTAGEPIGTVTYTVGDRVVGEAPIMTQTDVTERPALSFWQKWKRSAASLFITLLR